MNFFINTNQTFDPVLITPLPLIHMTGEWDSLASILEEGFRPSYCVEHITNGKETITAEVHWKIGDEQLHQTESALERGQYLVFRGMSYALIHDLAKARRQFDLARHELKIAGSPAVYLAELDIAEHLSEIASPQQRGLNLKAATIAAENAHKHFSTLAGTQVYPLQAMYSETAEFCDGILNGSALDKSFDGRQSLVLSVIENVSTAQPFEKGGKIPGHVAVAPHVPLAIFTEMRWPLVIFPNF